MGRSSVFSLEQIYRKQLTQTWSKIPEVFRFVNNLATPGGPAYGYFAGGNAPSAVSNIDRIDFGNDTSTASPKGNLSAVKEGLASVGNESYGYFAGGNPGGRTKVDRIDYADDTATAAPKGNLSVQHTNAAGAGNADYGYIGGGNPPVTSIIDRIDYSNDTATATPKGGLSSGDRGLIAATGNQSYGYWGGGSPGSGFRSWVDRLDYSNDTANTSPKGPLSSAKGYNTATGNASYGYFGGGELSPSVGLSTVDRIDYSSDTGTAPSQGPLNLGRQEMGATGSPTFGYFGGGAPNPKKSTIDRIDYSNDTATAATKGPLSYSTRDLAAVSGQEFGLTAGVLLAPATRSESEPISPALLGTNYGYWTVGSNPSFQPTSIIDRLDFDNDTATAVAKGPLSRTAYNVGAVGNKPYGYVAAGGNPIVSTVDRIDYSNDTATTAVKGPLSNTRRGAKGVGNLSYGYFGGGEPGPFSTVDRVDYANDTATAAPKGPMSSARRRLGSVSNLSYGYIVGGQYESTVDRIDFSNDTATASVRAPLSTAKKYVMGAGTNSYGYFAGGSQPNYISTIDRLDYASDTTAMTPAGPLWETQWAYGGGTGNASYAYFGGGLDSADPISWMARLDYTNDTATTVSKGPISLARYNMDAVSSRGNGQSSPTTKTVDKGADGYKTTTAGPAFGYSVGGLGYSLYQRVDYSNDTATAENRAHTTNASPGGGTLTISVGNGSHAFTYVSEGQSSFVSIIERYDYTNDTTNSTPKGNLAETRSYIAGAVGTTSYAYFMAGRTPGNSPTSTVQRVDYSNDTATAAVKGPLASARYHNNGGVGNQSYGYLGGNGLVSSSDIDRIDYSNDTATAVQKGHLTVNGGVKAATGNASYGYWGGGYPVSSYGSVVSRLDYSNDSADTVNKGTLTVNTIQMAAFGDTSYGYFAGGHPGPLTTVSRLDYSDDTTTSSPKGPLVQAVRECGGNSSRSNAIPGYPQIIPRIRWVDSVAEGPDITEGPAYGYIGGGLITGPGQTDTTILRIDYANDTATLASHTTFPGPSTSRSKYQHFAVSSTTHSYFGGGKNGGGNQTSDIYRLDLANDTATAGTPGGELTSGGGYVFMCTATGNHSYGYVGGGASPVRSTINRIDYSNDAIAAPSKGPLSKTRQYAGATGTQSYGYWGGSSPTARSTVDRVDYSNDTATASTKGNLSANGYFKAAAGNLSYGYWAGGAYAPGDLSTVDRVDYSNDTATASPKGPLSAAKWYMGSTSNLDYGYWTGGRNEPAGNVGTSIIERLDFASDTTTASPKGYMDSAKHSTGNTSARANGMPTANPPVAAPVQPPFPYPQQLAAPGPAYGYWGGGKLYTNNDEDVSTVDRIDFSNDTATAVVKGSLTAVRYIRGATGNKEYGYFGTGGPGTLSNVDRIDYSNDTASASARGNLDRGANNCDATGNASYGYWGGGWGPSPKSLVSRVDFSNDSATAAPKGNLTYSQYGAGAAGNQSYGYFAGGENTNVSNVSKIDYSNDTATATAVGNLSTPKAWSAAASNSDYVYIAGSVEPSPLVFKSTIDRIDFSNDTPTTSPKGSLSTVRGFISGTASPAYGYVGGGQEAGGPGTPVSNMRSTVDRIDFANDTATAVAKGPLSVARRIAGATGGRMNGLP